MDSAESLPVDAPNDKALRICPTVEIPPSAMTGTPNLRAYSATLYTAVPWGRPTAITVSQTYQLIFRLLKFRIFFMNS